MGCFSLLRAVFSRRRVRTSDDEERKPRVQFTERDPRPGIYCSYGADAYIDSIRAMSIQQFSIGPNTLARDYIERCIGGNPFASDEEIPSSSPPSPSPPAPAPSPPPPAFPARPIDGRKHQERGQRLAANRGYSHGTLSRLYDRL